MEFIGLNKLRRGDMMAIDPMIPHGIRSQGGTQFASEVGL